ncbi:protein FAM210B, mitochondrial-like [Aphis gossypii]|uniref:protein FAM210B, mitochondrial-like n=1 Tax=Aphis gossypii TaxID=80765 RepID=UPI00100EAFA4|nr:protein FAM210B, mitochondrial-like [Aphis gossypii]
MLKVLTSVPKVSCFAIRGIQCNFNSCKFVPILQQSRIQQFTRWTKPSVQYPERFSCIRLCHAKPAELTPREKLKIAAKEYGSVLIGFHVGISLISLGSVYFFISNGVDVQQWIGWMGMSNANENTKIVAGASQFIIAYAIHKSFAPVRISITLISVPLIVRYLRMKGIMKIKK